MKHVTRNMKIIILNAVLFFVLCSMFYVPWAMAHQVVEIRPVFAETAEGRLSNFHYLAQVQLETGLPTVPATGLTPGQELPSYIKYLFLFGLSLITIVALGQMIIGGIMYILAAGNAAKVEDAKDTIFQALFGLGILLVSYLLLRTINPDLVNLRNPTLAPISLEIPTIVTPTGPGVPPVPGLPSVLIYNVTSPQACASAGGKAFSPCQTYCLATPGLCSAGTVCCGTQP